MKTIALRFGEHFSPECGTIAAHQEIIDKLGYVWYGKMGSAVSDKVIADIKSADHPQILLIRSGKTERYWAQVLEIQHKLPPLNEIPEYYRDTAGTFKTWFKVSGFDLAARDVMSKCVVTSSGNALGEVSKHSMSPYFIIEYKEDEVK